MRLVLFTLFFGVFAHAQTLEDRSNGNMIPEPQLSDYSYASRTPGFSEATDIIDINGNAAE
jgi:hypothetical protein